MPLNLEICIPEKRFLQRSVEMAVLPGEEGDIAAMPGRAPLLITLRGGLILIYEGERVLERIFVSGGFADMGSDGCRIFADDAAYVSEISADHAQSNLEELELAFANVTAEDICGQDHLSRRIQAVRAQIEAAAEAHKLT